MELLTSGLFFYCGWRWGAGPSAWVWAGFAATLLALAAIDWESGLLPDALTLPLLWAGLISAALSWTGVVLPAALWGAVAGYLFLWAIFWAFKLCTGKEGMGYGDFKLLAALGAWLGWQSLIALILLASVLGSIVGLTMRYRGRLGPGDYLPFGPFLAAAGFATWVLGPATLNRWIGP
jgi:leader peptidase (prepilin peptidase)/N-methyltransferase